MSERKILIDGGEFVRRADAARRVGLVPDYVTRLARGELVRRQARSGLWFVNLASLNHSSSTQERQKEIGAPILARQRREDKSSPAIRRRSPFNSMPRRELNDRLKQSAHHQARRIRVVGASLLWVCLMAGAGAAFAKIGHRRHHSLRLQHAISDALR